MRTIMILRRKRGRSRAAPRVGGQRKGRKVKKKTVLTHRRPWEISGETKKIPNKTKEERYA